MSCFPCFGSGKKKNAAPDTGHFEAAPPPRANMSPPLSMQAPRQAMALASAPAHIMAVALAPMLATTQAAEARRPEHHAHKPSTDDASVRANIAAQAFAFRELAAATNHFMPDNLLAEGGFFRVYKGCLEKTDQTVAIKQLDRHGFQGNKEFLTEVAKLSHLHHENLINLIGYCADGDQRLLVYEYMPSGSLEDHLLDQPSDKKPIDWYTRMKVAYGAAQGLEYLHETANPPVIYMDFRASHILLDENFTAKLADFGLAKLGPMGDNTPVSSPMMGSYGYCAPEYDRSGQLTAKSDVYSFGVVLLELISGRRAIDTTRPMDEQNLVTWTKPIFKDQKRYHELVDPLIKGDYPSKGLNQVVAMAAMCLQDEDAVRPLMADVVMTLRFLVTMPYEQPSSNLPSVSSALIPIPTEDKKTEDKKSNHSDTSSSSEDYEDEDEEENEDQDIEER